MANRRRASIPFSLGSKNIRTLKDIQDILKSHPEDLILPAKDGRLKRFLQGFGKTYVDCLDPDNIQESIQKLAGIFGIEIKDVDFSLDSNIATDSSKVIELLEKDGTGLIEVSKGTFFFDKLCINRPVKIVGQGKSETLIKANILCVASDDLILENLTCECKYLIANEDISLDKKKTKFEYKRKYDFENVEEIVKKEFNFYENREKIKVSISKLENELNKKDSMKNRLKKTTFKLEDIANTAWNKISSEILNPDGSINELFLNYDFLSNKIKDYFFKDVIDRSAFNITSTTDEIIDTILKDLESFLIENTKEIETVLLSNESAPNIVKKIFTEINNEIKNEIPKKQEELTKDEIRKIIHECKLMHDKTGYPYLWALKDKLYNHLQDICSIYLDSLFFTKEKHISIIEQKLNEYLDTIEKAIHDLPKKKLCDLLKIEGDELKVYVQE